MSKQTAAKLAQANKLMNLITEAVLEAGAAGLDSEIIVAILQRVVETVEGGD